MSPDKALGLARSALGHCTIGTMRSIGRGEAIEAGDTLEANLERARVVGVLDAWQGLQPQGAMVRLRVSADGSEVTIVRPGLPCAGPYLGDSPDAARAAAAKAIEAGEV